MTIDCRDVSGGGLRKLKYKVGPSGLASRVTPEKVVARGPHRKERYHGVTYE